MRKLLRHCAATPRQRSENTAAVLDQRHARSIGPVFQAIKTTQGSADQFPSTPIPAVPISSLLPNPTPCHLPTCPCSGPTPCVHSVRRRFLSGLATGCTNSYSISSSSSSRRSWAMRSKDAHSSQPVIGRFPCRTSALWLRLEIRFMIIFIHHEIWQYNNKQITREKLCYLN